MELLVVLVIISVLAGFLVPQIIEMMKRRDALKTMDLITKLKTGISSFHTEYNRLPVEQGISSDGEDTVVLTDGSTPFIDALTGIPAQDGGANWNPKNLVCIEFPMAQSDRNGLVNTTRPYKLHDMWGKPFHILFDTNGDHQVSNPDTENSDSRISQPGGKPAGKFIATDVLVFSSGKDGVPHTADDIASWRQN